jgi:hypothetical protein
MVEVTLGRKDPLSFPEMEEALPESLLELEHILQELQYTYNKLRESTDLLVEEVRKNDGDEAREYYEYVQENLGIMMTKSNKMEKVRRKIDSLRGVKEPVPTDRSSDSCGAGGVIGHYI